MAAVLGGTHREGPEGAEGGAAWLPGCCGRRGAPHTLTARGRSFTPTRCSPMRPQGQRLAAHPSVRAGVWASGDPSGGGWGAREGWVCHAACLGGDRVSPRTADITKGHRPGVSQGPWGWTVWDRRCRRRGGPRGAELSHATALRAARPPAHTSCCPGLPEFTVLLWKS